MIRAAADGEFSYAAARGELAASLEKIIKAELIRLGWRLIKTHDLNLLLSELKRMNPPLAAVAADPCIELSEAYRTTRYPGSEYEDEDWPTFRIALAQIEALLAAAKAQLPPPP